MEEKQNFTDQKSNSGRVAGYTDFGGRKHLNKYCEKAPNKEHKMYYEYTWLISWDTGFVTNIVKCCYCGIQAQTSTMYEPNALHSLKWEFRKDTIHRRIIKGEIVDSQNSV